MRFAETIREKHFCVELCKFIYFISGKATKILKHIEIIANNIVGSLVNCIKRVASGASFNWMGKLCNYDYGILNINGNYFKKFITKFIGAVFLIYSE